VNATTSTARRGGTSIQSISTGTAATTTVVATISQRPVTTRTETTSGTTSTSPVSCTNIAAVIKGNFKTDYRSMCKICEREKFKVPASVYCEQCNESLCSTCSYFHKRFLHMKNHRLLEINAMPNSEQMAEMMRATHKELEKCTTEVNKAASHSNKVLTQVLTSIEKSRTDVIALLDKLEQKVTDVETFCITNDTLLDCLNIRCANMNIELQNLEADCSPGKSHYSWLEMLLTEGKLKQMRESIKEVQLSLKDRLTGLTLDSSWAPLMYTEEYLEKLELSSNESK